MEKLYTEQWHTYKRIFTRYNNIETSMHQQVLFHNSCWHSFFSSCLVPVFFVFFCPFCFSSHSYCCFNRSFVPVLVIIFQLTFRLFFLSFHSPVSIFVLAPVLLAVFPVILLAVCLFILHVDCFCHSSCYFLLSFFLLFA